MSQNETNFMRIERNLPTAPSVNSTKAGKPASPASSPMVADLNDSRGLNQALASTTQVRAEQVARAKALLANPNYPSGDQMNKVAGLLAANWPSGD